MKLITLVENTPGAAGCIYEHGLSIYIETQKHNILLDTGASDAFIRNAARLGIDLRRVDILILSHGHYDHAGGILDFIQVNSRAPIYMRSAALNEYYNLKGADVKYIGMDERIKALPQLVFTKEQEILDEQVSLYSGVSGRKLWPKGNQHLKCLKGGEYRQDTFDHEQFLVIREDGESVLVSGCAHNGILNILEKYEEIYGKMPDKVITGFHMKKNGPLNQEEKELVKETAEALKAYPDTGFYSGHCTGEEAFRIMKEIMGKQLSALHSGERII